MMLLLLLHLHQLKLLHFAGTRHLSAHDRITRVDK